MEHRGGYINEKKNMKKGDKKKRKRKVKKRRKEKRKKTRTRKGNCGITKENSDHTNFKPLGYERLNLLRRDYS